jgi:hypothetical protein
MNYFLRSLCIFLFPVIVAGQDLTSDAVLSDLHFKAGELRSNQRVLMVAYAPSMEDVGLISHIRADLRAMLHVAYMTNGEGFPDGEGQPFPHLLAARWRSKAFELTHRAGAGHTFMNLPYIDAASSLERVRVDWPADTVRDRWRRLLNAHKPDAVLITGFEHLPQDHPIFLALLDDIGASTRRARRSRSWVPLQIAIATGTQKRSGESGNSALKNMVYAEDTLRLIYVNHDRYKGRRQMYTRFGWANDSLGKKLSRRSLFPKRRVPEAMSDIDSAAQAFSLRIARIRSMPSGKKRESYLIDLVDVMQKVDLQISLTRRGHEEARRFLLDWKLSLDQIRALLLGVSVTWDLSEHIVTERQLTYLKIDTITGLDPEGRTEIFVPEVQQGWVLNELQVNHLPYTPGVEFRLLSGPKIEYDFPRSTYGLAKSQYRKPWYFFVVHQAKTAEYSFAYRIDAGVSYAPRFVGEVLTPVVRARRGEKLAVRLSNYTRDGVRDSLFVRTDRVLSTKKGFRLFIKDQVFQDTLLLDWKEEIPQGTHLAEVLIGEDPVANFVGRKFYVETTPGSPVTLIGSRTSSPLFRALERLEYNVSNIEPERLSSVDLPGDRKLILDQSIQGSSGLTPEAWSSIVTFVEAGGMVTIFSQDSDVISKSGLFPDVRFEPTYVADTSYSITLADARDLFTSPNDLTEGTWEGWIGRVASNRIRSNDAAIVEHARLGDMDIPVIFSKKIGKGTVLYVDLNLTPQWTNVLPSAYALLANIIEFERETGE